MGWVGTMISNEFINRAVSSSGKGRWVEPTWDKVLNSIIFFKASLMIFSRTNVQQWISRKNHSMMQRLARLLFKSLY